jgi:hypothetical protein
VGLAANRADRVPSEGETGPRDDQTVSGGLCSERSRSHTSWGWERAMRWSVVGFAVKGADHVPPEGGTGPRDSQQWVLQRTGQIMYILRAGQGHDIVSDSFKQT